jgi:hypothetical protein
VPGNGRGRAPAGLAFRPYSLGSSRTDAGRPAPRGVRPSPGAVSACTGSGLALQSGPCPVSPPCPPSLTSRPAEPSRSGLASTPNSPQFSVRSNSIFGARLPPPGNPAKRSKQSRRVQPRPGVGALGLEADRHTIRAFSLVACPLQMRADTIEATSARISGRFSLPMVPRLMLSIWGMAFAHINGPG